MNKIKLRRTGKIKRMTFYVIHVTGCFLATLFVRQFLDFLPSVWPALGGSSQRASEDALFPQKVKTVRVVLELSIVIESLSNGELGF